MPEYTLNVNGQPRRVNVPADMPLLWVLRDLLGLTGTKFGCGQSLCGACTVHLDGQPIRSCVTAVSEAARGAVTTIEGLAADGAHPVQKAWIAEDVPQCGYCQPGMIMSAAALIAKNPRPQDADIDAALGGHICRCGTYPRIRRAVHRAARSLTAGFGPRGGAGGRAQRGAGTRDGDAPKGGAAPKPAKPPGQAPPKPDAPGGRDGAER